VNDVVLKSPTARTDDGIRSQPMLFEHSSLWVNSPPPRECFLLTDPQPQETFGVAVDYFESRYYGQWIRFRRLRTIRRNMVCWQREVMV
jgi:hypothetical protein